MRTPLLFLAFILVSLAQSALATDTISVETAWDISLAGIILSAIALVGLIVSLIVKIYFCNNKAKHHHHSKQIVADEEDELMVIL